MNLVKFDVGINRRTCIIWDEPNRYQVRHMKSLKWALVRSLVTTITMKMEVTQFSHEMEDDFVIGSWRYTDIKTFDSVPLPAC